MCALSYVSNSLEAPLVLGDEEDEPLLDVARILDLPSSSAISQVFEEVCDSTEPDSIRHHIRQLALELENRGRTRSLCHRIKGDAMTIGARRLAMQVNSWGDKLNAERVRQLEATLDATILALRQLFPLDKSTCKMDNTKPTTKTHTAST